MYNFADSTVTASAFTAGANTGLTLVASTAGLTTTAALVIYYDDQIQSTAITISSLPAITGTVNVGNVYGLQDGDGETFGIDRDFPVSGSVGVFGYENISGGGKQISVNTSGAVYSVLLAAIPPGLNNIGVVTIGAGTVTIGAGTAQIGSVTASNLQSVLDLYEINAQNKAFSVAASISGQGYVSDSAKSHITNSVTIGSLPAISGTVTANISISSSAITSGSFTSLTSATLVPANTARKMATVYNLGAGQLFVNAGATATTLGGGFMVALSSGDFYECSYTTTTLSAIFATAGTASWVSH